MLEVSVWSVRLGTVGAFAVGGAFGWLARTCWLDRGRSGAAARSSSAWQLLH